MTRAFLALRLVDASEISRIGARLAESLGAAATHPEDLHVTLKFLGEVDEPTVAGPLFDFAVRSIDRIPRELLFDAVTAFPSEANASVVVLEATHPPVGLTDLASDVERAAERLGIAPDGRAYRPHVTLLRLHQPRPLQGPVFRGLVVAMRSLTLCSTLPSCSRPRYANLREATIGAPRPTTS